MGQPPASQDNNNAEWNLANSWVHGRQDHKQVGRAYDEMQAGDERRDHLGGARERCQHSRRGAPQRHEHHVSATEAPELLAELESTLLELEHSPQDDDLTGRAMHAVTSAIRATFDAFCQEPNRNGRAADAPQEHELKTPLQVREGQTATCRIHLEPNADLFASGTNPLLLPRDLDELGTATIVAKADKIPFLGNFKPGFSTAGQTTYLSRCTQT